MQPAAVNWVDTSVRLVRSPQRAGVTDRKAGTQDGLGPCAGALVDGVHIS